MVRTIVIVILLINCVFSGFIIKESVFLDKRTFAEPPVKPNIIVVMLDDLGYNDVSFNGSTQISTPNIDRIANQGMRCTNAYVSYSVYRPSRAGFMTGRYPQRFGFNCN